MRILQIIQKKQLRGAEVFACQLSNRLLAMGHEVKIVALLDGDADMPFDGVIEILHVNMARRMTDWNGWKKMHACIHAYQPDIVQANAGDTLKYAALSKKMFGWKAKLIFRNANKMGDFLTSRWKLHFNKWLIRELDFVASVSKECQLDFVRSFTWPESKIANLPIGVDPAVLATINPLEEKTWAQRFPVLLSVAGFVPEKNHLGLLRIFESVLPSYPEAVLVMIGEGKLRKETQAICREKGLADRVWFTGRRIDVQAFMQHANVLLMPSLIEGLPGVILEAFANRLPVVAYNVGGIPEVLKSRQTGWLVNRDDERSFAKAVADVLASGKSELSAMMQNAYEMTTAKYANFVIATEFDKVYRKLVPQPEMQSV